MSERGSTNTNTRKALLTYYQSKGRIVSIRRGLYATVPPSNDPDTYPIDPFLVAAKMADDAVLAYHTALEYHGKAYSVYNRLTYTSESSSRLMEFRKRQYTRISVPYALRSAGEEMIGVEQSNRAGVAVRVTNLERTFVDVLDKPETTGSWEEIWRSLEMIEFFDVDQVVRYVRLLGNATTTAKVGFFLDQHRESLMINDSALVPLLREVPKQPHYLNRALRKGCRLVTAWNLMVPENILNRSWAEVL
jgi:predicted transcriptional regulator of viral defense system